jgi:hypothetical protein
MYKKNKAPQENSFTEILLYNTPSGGVRWGYTCKTKPYGLPSKK